jgi:hypothetical protein
VNGEKLIRMVLVLVVGTGLITGIWWFQKQREGFEPVWHPQARHWGHTPLAVSWDPIFWQEHNDSMSEAIASMNRATGCELLMVGELGPGDVRIVSANGAPCGNSEALVVDPGHSAQTYLCPDGTAEIHVSYPGDITMSYLIVFHELGHVAGLMHDGMYKLPEVFPGGGAGPIFVSVMTPNVEEHAPRLGAGLRLPDLSDKDAAALHERYCR